MKKYYVILISSLIACSSWGMEALVALAARSAAQEMNDAKQPLSLLEIATKMTATNIDLAIQEDVRFLKADDQLTENNVRKKILNEIALLGLPDHLSNEAWQAYRRICKKRDLNQAQTTQLLTLDRCIVCSDTTFDKKQIAIVTNCNANECMLRVWDESIFGFKETLCQLSDGPIISIKWGDHSDTELVLLAERQVAIIEREENQFCVRYVADLCRRGEAHQRIVWDGRHKNLVIASAQQDTDVKHIVDCYTEWGNQLAYRHTIKPDVQIYDMHFKDNGRLGIERVNIDEKGLICQVLRRINDLMEEKIIAHTKDHEISVVTELPSLDGIAAYLVKQAEKQQ